ncbi:MAG: hypothetical protein VX178_06680, partial [Pseudomonadota bacterium]|nr:hypothetical protein [Pseudomonadota bacterium]
WAKSSGFGFASAGLKMFSADLNLKWRKIKIPAPKWGVNVSRFSAVQAPSKYLWNIFQLLSPQFAQPATIRRWGKFVLYQQR